jgi:hypothetical protein
VKPTGSLADFAPELSYAEWRNEVLNLTTLSDLKYPLQARRDDEGAENHARCCRCCCPQAE